MANIIEISFMGVLGLAGALAAVEICDEIKTEPGAGEWSHDTSAEVMSKLEGSCSVEESSAPDDGVTVAVVDYDCTKHGFVARLVVLKERASTLHQIFHNVQHTEQTLSWDYVESGDRSSFRNLTGVDTPHDHNPWSKNLFYYTPLSLDLRP